MIARLLTWLLGCRHAHRGFPFRAHTRAHAAEGLRLGVDYQRCTDCGRALKAKVQIDTDPRFPPLEPRRAQVTGYIPTALERIADEAAAHEMGVKL